MNTAESCEKSRKHEAAPFATLWFAGGVSSKDGEETHLPRGLARYSALNSCMEPAPLPSSPSSHKLLTITVMSQT